MENIEPDKKYILIPEYIENSLNESKVIFGKVIKESFNELKVLKSLKNGSTFIYKGRKYFIDEAL